MKSFDVKWNTYIDCIIENNKEGPKFKVGNHVGISKYINIIAKGSVPNESEEDFAIKKVKNTVPWTLVILKVKKLSERFTKNNCKK